MKIRQKWMCAAAAVVLTGTGLAPGKAVTQGTLEALDKEGKALGPCPLKHTDVHVSISGHIAYVSVTQKFTNPFKVKIEAVYTFPLGSDAAVGEMMMTIGDRQIVGKIKPREEARKVYEQAKAAGHVAGLLDQERANLFTQAVANIEPGNEIDVTIGYTETLKYEDGKYRFVFPMVVAPRFIPSGPPQPTVGRGAAAPAAPGAAMVPDAAKISPPVPPEGIRAGHDIAIAGWIDAGMPIRSIDARLHEVRHEWKADDHSRAKFELAGKKTIPNKDFVLEFSTASDEIADAVLAHTDQHEGYFLLVLQPPQKVQPKQVRPRELIFVIDTSGSQKGFPLETSRQIVRKVVQELRAADTFNVIAFANTTSFCWEGPVANTVENREKALRFVDALQASGGTRIDTVIAAALEGTHDTDKVRIVAFFSDGLIGNDMGVLDQVRKNARTTRVFVYGTGNSANRYLLDNMARFGRGEADYALTVAESERVARTFYTRIDAPVLTDIEIDWGDLAGAVEIDQTFPRPLPDLFSARPVVIKGRFRPDKARTGTITIRGQTGEGDFTRRVKVELPREETANAALAREWARAKVAELMSRDLAGAQSGKPDPAIKETIVGLGMKHRLMTQYTSFVAVEEKRVTKGGEAVTVDVPVEMPEGMSYQGTFGTNRGRLGRGGGGAPGGPGAPMRALGLRQFGAAPAAKGTALSATAPHPTPAPAMDGAIALPKPKFSGTPKNLPANVLARVKRDAHRPQGEFIIPKGVVNVALKKPVTASDASPVVGTPARVTDGNKEAVADAFVELGPKTQWVQIDLGKAHEVLAIAVWHEHREFARVYHDVIIQVADDKDFTKNVRTVYNNDHDNSSGLGAGQDWEYFETNAGLVVKLKGLKARYVRLYSRGSTTDDLNRYTEVEVYADPAK